jgi:hypothetical protein
MRDGQSYKVRATIDDGGAQIAIYDKAVSGGFFIEGDLSGIRFDGFISVFEDGSFNKNVKVLEV